MCLCKDCSDVFELAFVHHMYCLKFIVNVCYTLAVTELKHLGVVDLTCSARLVGNVHFKRFHWFPSATSR